MSPHVAGHGGGSSRTNAIALGLAELGHSVTLVRPRRHALQAARRQVSARLHLTETPGVLTQRLRRGGLDPLNILGGLWTGSRWDGDLVYCITHRPSALIPALALQRRGVPFVIDWCDLAGPGGIASTRFGPIESAVARFDSFTEPAAIRSADGVVVITQDLGDRARRWGVPSDRLHQLPPVTRVSQWTRVGQREARGRVGLPANRPIVLFAGFGKFDSDLLLTTATALLKRHNDCLLVLLGDPGPNVCQLATQPDFRDRVRTRHVTGREYQLWLATADVFLLPYGNRAINRARFPHKFVEYLAAGRPIVTNPTGEIADIMTRHEVGILTGEDGQLMADAAGTLLDDPARVARLGDKARALAESCFEATQRASDLVEFFDRITRQAIR